MIFIDRIYGVMDVKETVFEKIVLSQTFQRLHGIYMGSWAPGNPFVTTPDTRYEHSIGVFMLLRKYNASIPEQIAGLIHDVSHTAFSHLSDRLFGTTNSCKQANYQDSIHKEFVKNSEIASIIKSENFDLDYILDDTKFPLKEKNLPDICADRIDYSLRMLAHIKQHGMLLEYDEKKLSDSFIATDSGFIMKNLNVARQFANLFNTEDEAVCSCFDNVFYESALKDICIEALNKNILTKQDFFALSDLEIIQKLSTANIDLAILYEKHPKKYIAKNHTTYKTEYKKVRRIDPTFIDTHNNIVRLSGVDKSYAQILSNTPKYIEYKIKQTK